MPSCPAANKPEGSNNQKTTNEDVFLLPVMVRTQNSTTKHLSGINLVPKCHIFEFSVFNTACIISVSIQKTFVRREI